MGVGKLPNVNIYATLECWMKTVGPVWSCNVYETTMVQVKTDRFGFFVTSERRGAGVTPEVSLFVQIHRCWRMWGDCYFRPRPCVSV